MSSQIRPFIAFIGILALVAMFSFPFGGLSAPAANGDSITFPDRGLRNAIVGRYASLELDSSGNPVISYSDYDNGNLKIVHCNDPACADGDEAINTPFTNGVAGTDTSLALDSNGNPVVSFVDISAGLLRVLHCNDPNCAGDNESITAPDQAHKAAGFPTSLVLDAGGNPVVSYRDAVDFDLNILHCDDPNCAGNNDSITSHGPDGHAVGNNSSLILDSAGNPVVSFINNTDKSLMLLHCNDPNCLGGNDPVNSVTTGAFGTVYTSLTLDGSGFPVITFFKSGVGLTVVHCDDANCAGGNESVTNPDNDASAGQYSSIALDSNSFPVIAYHASSSGKLKVMHCNDANCGGGNEAIASPDNAGQNGEFATLTLDNNGNPVVAYFNESDGDLKLLHCNDANCAGGGDSVATADEGEPIDTTVGLYTTLALDSSGYPVIGHQGTELSRLRVVHCNDADCAGDDESITEPVKVGTSGEDASLALDANGLPVIGYYDANNVNLSVLHCNDPNCAGDDESTTTPDDNEEIGKYLSLVLDANGWPAISYYDAGNEDLKLLRCNDPNCAGNDESITSPDTGDNAGLYTSLVLDDNGNPVISYYGDGMLKLMHCNDAACSGGNEFTNIPDPDAGFGGSDTALILDSSGNPVIAFYGNYEIGLRVVHCNDANCAGNNESIASFDPKNIAGQYLDLALDGSGYPVVSYRAYLNGFEALKMLHCNDPNCTGGGESEVFPDPGVDPGEFNSLVLDVNGFPVVSYKSGEDSDLTILHCGSAGCQPFVTPTPTPTVTSTSSPNPTPTTTGTPGPTPTSTPAPAQLEYLPVVISEE